ncbi:MAG: DUF2961 domain-containing protein [Phycisphaerales bacterium]|nr:MAG: DUF2961 domain-containing protein [Phycisphaerales bacterium]
MSCISLFVPRNLSQIVAAGVVSGLFAFGPQTSSAERIELGSLLEQMIDRRVVAQFPEPAFVCRQASSYNRHSITPDRPDWFTGGDFDQFYGCDIMEGRKEWIMLDVPGPGVVTRWWQTQYRCSGTIRVYLDRIEEPIFKGTGDQLVAGDVITGPPLAANRGGGRNLYLPIPFREHCKITFESSNRKADFTEKKPRFTNESLFYVINYLRYAGGVDVKSLTRSDLESSRELIARVGQALLQPEKHKLDIQRNVAGAARTLNPGQTFTRKVSGRGAIASIRVNIRAEDIAQAMRSTVITAAFDGRETVWAPVGEFFGAGLGVNPCKSWWSTVDEDGWMACWWPMPYKESAEVSIINHGATYPVHLELDDLGIADWRWTDRTMYFHTAWRGQNQIESVGGDIKNMELWNYITIDGRGVYVGDSLSLYNRPRIDWGDERWIGPWWGEGDEQIWVDGESFPSHFGTGSEDYFGYAFNYTRPFEAPFHAQPIAQGNWGIGHTTNVRGRVHDRIPFKTRLKFDMELFHWQPNRRIDYATTTHWYAFDGATCNGLRSIAKVREKVGVQLSEINGKTKPSNE